MEADSPDCTRPACQHLPYELDTSKGRLYHYETVWKRVALELLLKHCRPEGVTVLDYGCGRGETVQMFRAAGFDITGADVDPECVRLTSRFGPAVLLRPESGPAQFAGKSFDIVTCFHVLEHVENPKRTLSGLAQVARRYVVLAVPNLRQLHHLFLRRIEKVQINEGHLQAWDHWHLLNLATRHCGMELVEWGFDATILPGASRLAELLFGAAGAIKLETGLFKKLFPFHGLSVIGLFRVK